MIIDEFLEECIDKRHESNQPSEVEVASNVHVHVYPRSLNRVDEHSFFMGREGNGKYLYVISPSESELTQVFDGASLDSVSGDNKDIRRCPLNHVNAESLRQVFRFARPVLVGVQNSFGMGDRLGLANPGHLRAIRGVNVRPVLAQQSIRELERTDREPEEVMDAATWAAFQEGYRDGFGADADHLKTTADIDRMVRAGFTMFTIDPGGIVVNGADTFSMEEITRRIQLLPWEELSDSASAVLERYVGVRFEFGTHFSLVPGREEVLRALVKYGRVILQTMRMHDHLKSVYPQYSFELELSVDESESVTSPFEHFLVVNELRRHEIHLVSLAPRFVGRMEKGIDYIGDLEQFQEEYLKHVRIADKLGPYKISIHSGSDKFRLYEAIGSLGRGYVHVKTAGTSYLEALRVIAHTDPALFQEILEFARVHYEDERQSYHVSADLSAAQDGKSIGVDTLPELLNMDDVRQILHVTFGRVLTDKTTDGKSLFKDRLIQNLNRNEELHYEFIQHHFRKHLESFAF